MVVRCTGMALMTLSGRRRQFLSFLFSLACSFCALLVIDGCMWSLIRLFLIKENLSSLRLVIMGEAAGGGAGRQGHSSGGSAGGRKVSLAVRRRHQTRYSVVRSFDNVAALRRAACLKGLGSLTEENEKRRLARRWWPSSSRQSCAPVTRQADVNSDTCRT